MQKDEKLIISNLKTGSCILFLFAGMCLVVREGQGDFLGQIGAMKAGFSQR